MAEVRHQLVGDPAEEVVGLGEPFELDVGAERRAGGRLLVDHAVRSAGPRRLVGAHLGADLLGSPPDHGQAAGELAEVVERHAVDAAVAGPERDRDLVDRESVGLGERDERGVEREARLDGGIVEHGAGDLGIEHPERCRGVANGAHAAGAANDRAGDAAPEGPKRPGAGRRAAADPARSDREAAAARRRSARTRSVI